MGTRKKQSMVIRPCFLAFLGIAAALNCCEKKTVGDKSYTLVDVGGTVPQECPHSCIYSQDQGSDGQNYCFKSGSLEVTCHEMKPPVSTSYIISGPGHDNVEQRMDHYEHANETHIYVPAHGDYIAQKIILHGFGGKHNRETPLITYIRDGICHITEIPADINPQESAQNKKRSLISSSTTRHVYQLFTNPREIKKGTEEYQQLACGILEKCAGNQIWKSTSEIHSAESFESLESDHIDLDNLGRLSFRKIDDPDNRQNEPCQTKWNACLDGRDRVNNRNGSNCWYWQPIDTLNITEQHGNPPPALSEIHMTGLWRACVTCHQYTGYCPTAIPDPCACNLLNSAENFARCYLDDSRRCLPGWEFRGDRCVCVQNCY